MIQQCLLAGFGASGGGGGPTGTLLEDHFTDFDNTNLTSHLMDIGPGQVPMSLGWSVQSGTTWEIFGNALHKLTNSATNEICYADAGNADVTITAKLVAGADATIGIIGRAAGVGFDCFTLFLANGSFTLYEVSGGTPTPIGTGSYIGSGTLPVTLKLVFSGTSIKASVNGGTELSVTSAVRQTSTFHGFYINQTSSGQFMDDFLVTSP